MKTLSRNLLRTFLIISLSFCCQVDRSGAGVPPSADFSATPPAWSVPAAVSFTDSSSGNVTSWLWNFGDGTQSNLINPLHVYSTPGKYTVSLTVTSPDGTGSKVKADYVSVEEHVPVATEYLVRVDPTSHRKFGLYYPVTYKFRLPAGARDLAAQYRYWEGSWNPLPERQRTDNFNGVDAVRFDYTGGLAYLSVRLSRWSDSLYLRIVDSSGEPVAVVFDSIPKYYDERKAAVVLTLDDWDGSGDAAFRAAADLLASENLPFTVGLITASTPWASVQEKADQLGDHMEIASHSIYHSCSATEYGTRGYQTEVAGSRELIRSNLTFSSHPYVPAYVEPCGYSDDNLKSAVTAGDYLVTRSSNDNPASGAVFADWDAAQGRYGRGAVSYTDIRDYTDAVQLANANNLFNDALAGGTIYHLMDHPWKGYWYPNSWLMQHLDYIKGRSEIWYVPYGQLYQYHFLQEMRGSLTIQPLNPASVVASLAAAPLSGTVPLSVAFTDTSSGTITSWLWDFGDGASSTVQHPVHVYSAAGAYNVKLTVSGPGGSDLRAVTGMIRAVAPTPTTVSITSPAANATYSAPAAISITAAATAGTGTTVRQVDFYSGTTLIGTATSSPYGVTWSNVPAGNYTLTASVTDSAGSLKWSAPVAVSVMANPLPTVTITEPASGTSYLAPAEIAVSPLVTAGTGATVTRVEYYADSQLVASSSTSPFRAAWSNVAPGGYTLTARVTDSNGGSATSAPVLVSVIDNTLPAPWATRDVGSVGLAGSARSLDGNTFTLAGSGADIWGSADAFRFVYRPLAGDGSIVAKVASLQNTNPYAKAGVMMRETLAANSVHAMMDLTPTTGAEFSRRVATGGTTAATVMASLAAPYWVKLSRSGNTFTGYVSSDGLTWTQAGSSSITMANTIYVGLVVTSHYNTTLCTASFDYLDLMGTSIVPPAAILTAPESGATFSAPASLLVTATASAGTGAALKQVDFYADGVQIGTATAAPYAMNWNNVAAGSYSLTAMVTDSLGGTATSSPATITVTANLPPTVSITAPADGASYTAPAGIAVTATATAGGGASIVQVDFYADGTLLGTAMTAPFSVFWTNVAAGSYSLRAQVTDSLGAFASSPPVGVTVVSYSAPTVTISSPSSGASFTAPATVPITVATTAGTGATIKQVEFYADGNVIGTSTVSPFGYTWSNVAEGSYQVTAKVTDSLGASATSQAVALQVTSLPTTAPPSVTISAPLSGASYLAPATIAITATATAGTGGTVSRVDFYADGMQIGTATAAPYTVSFSSVAAGSYSLTAKVTDSLGASATSSAVTVSVNPYVPPAATISSPANGASYLAPASIPISATASPGSGATISKVEFFSNGTPIGAATTTPYTVTWGGVAAGSYSLTAKVTDSLGVSGTSPQVSVTVNPYLAPTVVITAPPEGASFTAPAAITMAASATAGSGAVIQKVEYLANNVLVASATTAPFSATWNKAAAGSYLLTAKVTDSLGATAVSAAVTVTVVNGPADLVISKNHKGNVRAGQAASYQITVSNSGTGPSTGSVTVRDLLPTQLVATGIKGTGWTCTLSTLTCTRSDALAAGAKYPVITVTANVPKVPTTVTNTATVSGGGELNTSNDTATDVTVIR